MAVRSYTVDELCKKGPPFAMAMLLRCLKVGEPFITYGAIGRELEYQLGINRIFPTQIGWVAGSLMKRLLDEDPNVPLINALIARPNGIPGSGAGDFFADRYSNERYRHWGAISKEKKIYLVSRERENILRYKNWAELNSKIFGEAPSRNLRKIKSKEQDGIVVGGKVFYGPESQQHKNLKLWVSENPQGIGLRKSFGKGVVESPLLSGDIIDVLFVDGTEFITVEVKSCLSNDEDLRRGIYQCVKYRAVKRAEQMPSQATVKAILVTERQLNEDLKARARLLDVTVRCVKVN